MSGHINHENLLNFAWLAIKPYIMEAPNLLLNEYKLLDNTRYICDVLTSPEKLFEYMGFVSVNQDGAVDPDSGFSLTARICKTKAYKKIPLKRRLSEIVDITNMMSCFLSLFSTRLKAVKQEYQKLLEESYFEYKLVSFYYVSTQDLLFKSFSDFILYFDKLCDEFKSQYILTKGMVEIFCSLMPSIISKRYNLNQVLAPSYAYKNLLPMYIAKEKGSNHLCMVTSMTINRCFMRIPNEHFYEDETPKLFDYILERLFNSLTGSVYNCFSADSIFNHDITGLDTSKPAKNICALTKKIKFSNSIIHIYSYNKTLDDIIMVASVAGNPNKLFYMSDKFMDSNNAPLELALLQTAAISDHGDIRELTEKEEEVLNKLIADIQFVLQ